MSTSWTTQWVSFVLCVAAGARALQWKAWSLTRPPALRRARAGLIRVVTVVAGH